MRLENKSYFIQTLFNLFKEAEKYQGMAYLDPGIHDVDAAGNLLIGGVDGWAHFKDFFDFIDSTILESLRQDEEGVNRYKYNRYDCFIFDDDGETYADLYKWGLEWKLVPMPGGEAYVR